MFRFSGVCMDKIRKFLNCKRSKIGTFLNAGWRCGGRGIQGRALFRSASPVPVSLVPFLSGTRKEQYLIDKLRFIELFAVPNRAVPNGVAAIAAPKSRTARGGLPTNTGLSDFIRQVGNSDQSSAPNGVIRRTQSVTHCPRGQPRPIPVWRADLWGQTKKNRALLSECPVNLSRDWCRN